jgi:hypothetical protein
MLRARDCSNGVGTKGACFFNALVRVEPRAKLEGDAPQFHKLKIGLARHS